MTTRSMNIGDVGGLGIFNLLAEGLALRSREPDAFERVDHAEAQAPRRTLAERIDDWFWRRHQRSVEMRLARAQDIFELERLIRGLERGDVSLHR
jgi:hypothetical protein